MIYRLELLVSGGALFSAPLMAINGEGLFASLMLVVGTVGALQSWLLLREPE